MKQVLIMCLFGSLFCSACGQKAPTGNVMSFKYSTMEMAKYSGVTYTADYIEDGDRVVLTYRRELPFSAKVYADKNVLKRIGEIVSAHKMYQYKSHYTPKFNVSDGTSWGLRIVFDSAESISSGGHMAYPEDNGIEEIISYIDSFFRDLPPVNVLTAKEVEDIHWEYDTVKVTQTGPQAEVIFWTQKKVKNFKILALTNPEFDDNGKVSFSTEVLHSQEELLSYHPLKVKMAFFGTIPNNGISYIDDDGKERRFSVEQSGEDGSLFLREF